MNRCETDSCRQHSSPCRSMLRVAHTSPASRTGGRASRCLGSTTILAGWPVRQRVPRSGACRDQSDRRWAPFHKRQDVVDPVLLGAAPQIDAPIDAVPVEGFAWGCKVACGGQTPFCRVVILHCQRQLLYVVEALDPPGRLAGLLHGRQQQRHQHPDNGDHDQQFYERETTASRRSCWGNVWHRMDKCDVVKTSDRSVRRVPVQ